MADDTEQKAKFQISQAVQELVLAQTAAAVGPALSFVHVGANDGRMNDPIAQLVRAHRWSGVLFEPVTAFFQRLAINYADQPQLRLVQTACGDAPGVLPFYQIRDPDAVPYEWMRGLSTFDRPTIRKHFASDALFEQCVEEVAIEVQPLDVSLEQLGVQACDLLVVDTEGFDLRVMLGFDAARWRPVAIMVEHQHLAADDRAALRARLHAAGYARAVGYSDTFYYRADRFPVSVVGVLRGFEEPVLSQYG